jgi:hypothetical protein
MDMNGIVTDSVEFCRMQLCYFGVLCETLPYVYFDVVTDPGEILSVLVANNFKTYHPQVCLHITSKRVILSW